MYKSSLYQLALISILLPSIMVGCGKNPIEEYVDSQWPPVSLEDQQSEAIGSLRDNLNTLKYPTIGFGLDIDTVSPLLLNDALKNYGVTSLKLTTDKQLVKADISYDVEAVSFTDVEILQNLAPRIKGKLSIYMGLDTKFNPDINQIHARLLPHVNSFDVESIEIKEDYDVTIVGVRPEYANLYSERPLYTKQAGMAHLSM